MQEELVEKWGKYLEIKMNSVDDDEDIIRSIGVCFDSLLFSVQPFTHANRRIMLKRFSNDLAIS